ncbi:MAG TPA: hypothetical protein VHQ65_17000 [Thermoanaerobaculia bacterium]|nr:hypothetical protein [Thermoanaerobaculia bacterium]
MTRRDLELPTGPSPGPRSGAVSGADPEGEAGAAASEPARAAAPVERRDGQLRPEWFGRSATAGAGPGPDPTAAEALATRLATLPAPLLREVTHYAEYLAARYATDDSPDGC